MAQFNNERLRNLRIGIGSYTENELVLDVIGDTSLKGDILDSTGSRGENQYVLTSTPGGLLWQSVTGPGGVGGINVTTASNNLSYYLPFVPISAGTTALTYVAPTNLTYNPFTSNLGIGTTNPTATLFVGGDGYFTGIVTASNINIVNTFPTGDYGDFTPTIDGFGYSIAGLSSCYDCLIEPIKILRIEDFGTL